MQRMLGRRTVKLWLNPAWDEKKLHDYLCSSETSVKVLTFEESFKEPFFILSLDIFKGREGSQIQTLWGTFSAKGRTFSKKSVGGLTKTQTIWGTFAGLIWGWKKKVPQTLPKIQGGWGGQGGLAAFFPLWLR